MSQKTNTDKTGNILYVHLIVAVISLDLTSAVVEDVSMTTSGYTVTVNHFSTVANPVLEHSDPKLKTKYHKIQINGSVDEEETKVIPNSSIEEVHGTVLPLQSIDDTFIKTEKMSQE